MTELEVIVVCWWTAGEEGHGMGI